MLASDGGFRKLKDPDKFPKKTVVVPEGYVFVLGDNRGNSADSRYIGFIPDDSVVARPTLIYFSRDADTGEIRWSRIGRGVRE